MWVNVDLSWQDFKLKWFQISDSSKKKKKNMSTFILSYFHTRALQWGVISCHYVITATESEIKTARNNSKKCQNCMQVLFNRHLGSLRGKRAETVRAGINWCGCEG